MKRFMTTIKVDGLHLLQYLNTIKTLQFSILGDNLLKDIICRAHKVLSRAHDITSFP